MSEELATYDARTQIERAMPARESLRRATDIAKALAPVIEESHLFVQIGSKRHVLFEGWTTLGALCGPLLGETVSAVVAWTRPIDGGFEARVEAITYSGRVVGAAEGQCTRAEERWKSADDYAIRSMAQTRAGSKAMRMPLGWIMQLAGFEGTPAEEMDGVKPAQPTKGGDRPAGLVITQPQVKLMGRLLDDVFGEPNAAGAFIKRHAPEILKERDDGITFWELQALPRGKASQMIDALIKLRDAQKQEPREPYEEPDDLPFE